MSRIADFTKKEWEAFVSELKKDIEGIKIPHDINPLLALKIIAKVDDLYSTLRIDFAELESLEDTVESIIREIEKTNWTGRNDSERKLNSIKAAQNYKKPNEEHSVNLYEMLRVISQRNKFVKSILDVLLQKQQRLVNVNGMMKLDPVNQKTS
jgi:hypothetical protein